VSDWITIKEDNDADGYKTRAKRIGTPNTKIIVVEWHHPNMGWQDAGVFIKFAHSLKGISGWKMLASVSWLCHEDADEFLEEYPKFKRLFCD